MLNRKIKTRFAPSPTGMMHLGNGRSCILSYLFSKTHNGEFILRIDDTDIERNSDNFEEQIYEDIKWLNITYDKKIKQSERNHIYEEYFNQLKDLKYIYPCYEENNDVQETTIYNRKSYYLTEKEKQELDYTITPHWRFYMQKDVYEMKDGILGNIKIKRSWSDPIIRRTNGSFTYNFTSAVDDYVEKITHVIRSMEHLKNAFIQQEIIECFQKDYKIDFYHLPLITNINGEKLSKRKGDLSLKTLKEEGVHYLSIFSIVTSLGSNKNPLITSHIEDFMTYVSLSAFSRSSPKFDKNTLERINRKIIRNLSNEELKKLNFDEKIWSIIKDNVTNLNEYTKWEEILNYNNFYEEFSYSEELKLLYTKYYIDFFSHIDEKIKKDFLQKLRLSLTGESMGPELRKIFAYKLPLLKMKILC